MPDYDGDPIYHQTLEGELFPDSTYCVSPSCAHIAEQGSQYCAIHNGNVLRSKHGQVIYSERGYCAEHGNVQVIHFGTGSAFCPECGEQV